MKLPTRVALACLLALPPAAAAQTEHAVPPTPGEQDIPVPVPGEVTLAGAERPDITRFLNVRTAVAPSLSPDGRRVAFRTQISGQPQLWVVDAESGWPKQLTFGEPITFHRWSPAGDWILYGQDRGGDEREGFYRISADGYRGSTGYGRTYARLNDRRLREDELLDLEAAVAWLAQRPNVDGSRVAIMGGSYGGYLTMAGLTRLPGLFTSGVAFVGVSNWITALEGASPQLRASDRIEYGDIDDPDDRRFFEAISPLTHVRGIRAPIMVLHGANDPRDPVEESDQFVRAIRQHGGEVEYLRFRDEGHSIRRLANRIIAYRRIAAFLEATLAE